MKIISTILTSVLILLGLNSFSQVNKSSLEDFFVRKLNETRFTSDALPYARNAASRFLALATLDNFEEVYSYSPINNSYTIHTSKLPYNMQRWEWGGSRNAIKRNARGQFTAKADKSNKGEANSIDKKFNTIVSAWLNEYLSKYYTYGQSNYQKKTTKKSKGSIRTLSDYIVRSVFNNNPDACKEYLNNLETEELKKQMMSWAKEHVLAYQRKSKELKDEVDFKPVNSLMLEYAIRHDDWDEFLKQCNLLGWTPKSFLRQNGIYLLY